MLDANALEAAIEAYDEGQPIEFSICDSLRMRAAITAYLQAVGPEPAVAVKPLTWGVYHALGQSTKLIAHDAFGNEFARLDNPISKSADEIAVFKAERQTAYEKTIRSALEAETGGGDDWTVDDTLTAREILNYLGIGSDASLEPFADRRRDHVAKIIQKRIAATLPAAMTCDEQFALATKLAGDLGYDLVPEPPHPDTPVDNFSGQTIPPADPVVREYAQERYDDTPELGAFNAGFRRAMKNIVAFCDARSALVEPAATPPAERVVETLTPDIYSKAWRDQMGKLITDDMVILALDAVDPDWNDEFSRAKARSNSRNWMRRVLRITIPLAAALAAKPAVKDDERVVALLDERQKRAEQVHDRILAARDGIRVNLSPDSPEWLRDAFNKLHEAHHIMGGDPFDMHMRAALAAKEGRS